MGWCRELAHTLLVDARGAAIAGFFITVSCGIVFLLTLRVTDGTFSALARQSLVDEVQAVLSAGHGDNFYRCHECDAAAIKCGMFFNCMHSVFKNQTQREDFLSSAEVTNFVVYATIEACGQKMVGVPLLGAWQAMDQDDKGRLPGGAGCMPALPRLSVDLLHNVGAAVLPAVARLEVWCLKLRGMRGSGSDAKPGDGDDKDL